MDFTTVSQAETMLGKQVTAMGACGMKNGIEVTGVLTEIEKCGDAIVTIEYGRKKMPMLCLVNRATLKLTE